MNYNKLMSPGTIGGVTLKNRIVLAAMGSNYAADDGSCSEQLLAYYEERARGGTGLVIVETSSVAYPAGSSMPNMLAFSSDEFLPGLTELAERVHRHGSKVAAQLNHSGKIAQNDVVHGRPIMVPSIPVRGMSDMFAILTPQEAATFVTAGGPDGKGPRYHVMEQEDIDNAIKQFANGADLAKRAGFDAVEIHAGHGYMISSFLSRAVNKRTDKYGGELENRARLLTEIITAIRDVVGPDFPILMRLDAKEFRVENGVDLPDCIATAKLAEQAGIDAVDVSSYGSTAKGIAFTEGPLVHEPGGYIPFAKAVKQAVSIPVIAVGRIELDVAEKGLQAGDFDFVAMGRKLLADPELPNKVAAGKADTVRPCIYCYICVSKIFINQPMCCAVNTNTGREHEPDIIKTGCASKKILVIGGGPGGMEAARLLSLQGHQVSLWEREKDLGGTVRVGALPYEPNERIITYLGNTIRSLPINIQMGKTATEAAIVAEAPDLVVIAVGALRTAPDIKGKDLRHVFDGEQLRGLLFGTDPEAIAKLSLFQRLVLTLGRMTQLLRSISALRMLSKIWMPMSNNIVVIGGGLVGLELAEYLVERGRKITILEPSANLGPELSIVRRARVIHLLREHGVEMVTQAEIEEITPSGVTYKLDGESKQAAGEQVLIAMGASHNLGLAESLESRGIEVATVGDCKKMSYIDGAILDARKVAESLA